MKIGDKVYLVQVIGGHVRIVAGIVLGLCCCHDENTEADSANVRYALGDVHVDNEWLSDLASNEVEARTLLAERIEAAKQGLRDELAKLETVDVAAVAISDNTDKRIVEPTL